MSDSDWERWDRTADPLVLMLGEFAELDRQEAERDAAEDPDYLLLMVSEADLAAEEAEELCHEWQG